MRLVAELGGPISTDDAAKWLGLVLEAVVENYTEYIDYNTTTTQSDRGEMLYTLLDFLRLQTSYDRVAWNLLPVMLAHEVLVRCGREDAADVWREAIAARSKNIAADHMRRLTRLVGKYGMRLQTVADRLSERFVRPLAIDRLRALVGPAIDELRGGAIRSLSGGWKRKSPALPANSAAADSSFPPGSTPWEKRSTKSNPTRSTRKTGSSPISTSPRSG